MRACRYALRFLLLVGSLSLLLAGCVTPGTAPPGSDGPRSPGPTVAAAAASMSPKTSIEASSSAPPSVEPGVSEPPAAWIAVEGGDPVVGELGSFSWNNSGSSSPGLDGTPIHVGAGEPVTMTLASPVDIDRWQVSRVLPGNRDGVGAISMAEGTGQPVSFAAPSTGVWSVEVQVSFAGNLGSAAYYWRMAVD